MAMQIAQLLTEHNASLATMQVAYASHVGTSSPGPSYQGPRFQRRKHWLNALVKANGGPKSVGEAVATPATHITAMCNGNRGVGDELADRIERKFGKPNGWLDRPIDAADFGPSIDAESLRAWGAALLAASPANRQGAAQLLATYFQDPTGNADLVPNIIARLTGLGQTPPAPDDPLGGEPPRVINAR